MAGGTESQALTEMTWQVDKNVGKLVVSLILPFTMHVAPLSMATKLSF